MKLGNWRASSTWTFDHGHLPMNECRFTTIKHYKLPVISLWILK
jgi:hypothetical protein